MSLNPSGATAWASHSIHFKRKKNHGIGYMVHSHTFFISKTLEEHEKWFGTQRGLQCKSIICSQCSLFTQSRLPD